MTTKNAHSHPKWIVKQWDGGYHYTRYLTTPNPTETSGRTSNRVDAYLFDTYEEASDISYSAPIEAGFSSPRMIVSSVEVQTND